MTLTIVLIAVALIVLFSALLIAAGTITLIVDSFFDHDSGQEADTAEALDLYDIQQLTPETIELAELVISPTMVIGRMYLRMDDGTSPVWAPTIESVRRDGTEMSTDNNANMMGIPLREEGRTGSEFRTAFGADVDQPVGVGAQPQVTGAGAAQPGGSGIRIRPRPNSRPGIPLGTVARISAHCAAPTSLPVSRARKKRFRSSAVDTRLPEPRNRDIS